MNQNSNMFSGINSIKVHNKKKLVKTNFEADLLYDVICGHYLRIYPVTFAFLMNKCSYIYASVYTSTEIKCTVPTIENGYVPGEARKYNEHEVLHFECNDKYKPSENRASRCTKIGLRAEWSITPMCERKYELRNPMYLLYHTD